MWEWEEWALRWGPASPGSTWSIPAFRCGAEIALGRVQGTLLISVSEDSDPHAPLDVGGP